jgi:hypothetical protein
MATAAFDELEAAAIEDAKKETFFLHRVNKDGWRDRVRTINAKHLGGTLWALRQVESIQWFMVRQSDGMVIAQSKDCQWTARE